MSKQYSSEEVISFMKPIRNNYELFKNGVKGHISNEIVLLLGSTGCGKSTIMNLLAGQRMEILEINGDIRLDVVHKDYAGIIRADQFEPMSIGHSGDSETNFPNYVMTANKQFWDCPGFGDTREPDVEISNNSYINYLLKQVMYPTQSENNNQGIRGVQLLIVQSYSSTLDEGGKAFRETIENICQMFPQVSTENLVQASTFVFTKVGQREPKGEKYLANILKRVSVEETAENKRLISFLEVMKNKLSLVKHLEIPKVTEQDITPTGELKLDLLSIKQNIMDVVISDHFILRNSEVNTVTSSSSHLKLLAISTSIEEILFNTMFNIISKVINERIALCYDEAHYKAKVTDNLFKPLSNQIKTIILQSLPLLEELKALQENFINFIEIPLTQLSPQQVEEDRNFIINNIMTLLMLADEQDFLTNISPNLTFHYETIDDMCLSLVGEVEQCSSYASTALQAELLAQKNPHWCSIS